MLHYSTGKWWLAWISLPPVHYSPVRVKLQSAPGMFKIQNTFFFKQKVTFHINVGIVQRIGMKIAIYIYKKKKSTSCPQKGLSYTFHDLFTWFRKENTAIVRPTQFKSMRVLPNSCKHKVPLGDEIALLNPLKRLKHNTPFL